MSAQIEVFGFDEAVKELEKMSLRISELPNVLGLEAVHIVNKHFKNKMGSDGPWAPSKNNLIDTGNLRDSISHKAVSNETAIVGSPVEYAKTHNEGMTIRPKKGKYLKFKGRDGQDVYTKEVKIPKREFLYISKMDEARLVKKAVKYIEGNK